MKILQNEIYEIDNKQSFDNGTINEIDIRFFELNDNERRCT
jgi:hypothetical protein